MLDHNLPVMTESQRETFQPWIRHLRVERTVHLVVTIALACFVFTQIDDWRVQCILFSASMFIFAGLDEYLLMKLNDAIGESREDWFERSAVRIVGLVVLFFTCTGLLIWMW